MIHILLKCSCKTYTVVELMQSKYSNESALVHYRQATAQWKCHVTQAPQHHFVM